MGHFIDLQGEKFGKLTVVERVQNDKHKNAIWKCQCDCGNYSFVSTNDLRRGHITSCGCNLSRKYDKVDLSGTKFGRLIPIKKCDGNGNVWLCRCECGKEVKISANKLINGGKKSCGCLHKDIVSKLKLKHNKCNLRIYKIWANMKQRCTNHKNSRAKNYIDRGISLCKEWYDFISFYEWAINNGYKDELTIERVDVNRGYEPSNCIWITLERQAYNKTNTHWITYKGKTKSLTEWAIDLGIKKGTLKGRINSYGWDIEKALLTPVKKRRYV